MILDVGCGNPSLDLSPIEGEDVIHIDVDPKSFHLEVQCDAHALPFKENIFATVYANHILEHLDDPIKALKELRRVSTNLVIIKVPNASYFKWKNSSKYHHIFSWNKYTLRNLLERFFKKVTINSTQREYSTSRIHKTVAIFLTLLHGENELTAVCSK